MKLIKMTSVMLTLALTLGACSNSSTNEQNSAQGGENSKNEAKAALNNKTFTVNDVKFTMVKVEGGTFTMGASGKLIDKAVDNEYPAHKVKLSPYYIGQTEVTQELWVAVMGDNPSLFKGADLPVEHITWDHCKEFISRLNNLTGEKFRLPTEAEWEFAARGGNLSKDFIYSGSNNLFNVAWFSDNSNGTTHPVATKQPNELGIYDMNGNVEEWCNDFAGDYNSADQTNPTGLSSGEYHSIRGSSIIDEAIYFQVSHRDGAPGVRCERDLGFRLAL